MKIPLTIDYLALREAIKHQIYIAPDGHAELWSGGDNCQFLNAINPDFSRIGTALKFETAANLALGVPIGANCLTPIKWNGFIEAATAPYITPDLQLKFHVRDLNLLDAHHKKSVFVGKGFDLIKQYFIPRFESFTYDLNPAVQQLGALAEAASTPDVADRIRTAMATLRSEPDVTPTDGGVRITLVITVPNENGAIAAGTPAPLTPEEVAAFQKLLDQWDAFLAFAIKQMGIAAGDEQFRRDIMQILLDSRFRLVAALSTGPASVGPDPVRALFLDEWNQLHDAVKAAAVRGTLGARGLELMSFISAGDALFALDQAAPALGMRISADDLRRLAHILAPAATGDPLAYDYTEDPELKKLFDVPEPPEMPGKLEETDAPIPLPGESPTAMTPTPSPSAGTTAIVSPSPTLPAQSPSSTPSIVPTISTPAVPPTIAPSLTPTPSPTATPASTSWLSWPLRILSPADAYADEPGILGKLENVAHVLRRAVVNAANSELYRNNMGQLLDLSAQRQLSIDQVDTRFQPVYKNLVLSAAWQESCWRQFVLADGHVRWLESSTGDIGLMQVNKRVWRGFYNIDRLKWDVLYNAGAGAEILSRMMEYAVRSGGRDPRGDALARSAYAGYNGGPAALHRWMRREPAEQRAIDNAFWKKYQAVQHSQSIDIMSCAESWGHAPGH
ncbi:MAG TPA: transglycosylase SLT domain-containing protein [Candidatus Binataceae bacterium]|nr:transglycosylase SLT domain-containing protein [Candidatus Binataceae bacterium]